MHRFGQGSPIKDRRAPSVPPRIGTMVGEERPEGVWPTVLVELEDENGQLRLLRQKDHYLYEQQIEEGDQVILEQEILKRIE